MTTLSADHPLPAPVRVVLPDRQTIERVRLYERQQLDTGLWMYRTGVPSGVTNARSSSAAIRSRSPATGRART
ncbi:hypothetical protein [Streptomyces violascens]|uniref:hypothetical protein n=1 Tax=Streptomyces violascens TaxID=67381 RepID=UPI00368F08FA